MASDYQMLRKGMNSFSDYMQLEDEFRMKKEKAARQAQMDALTMQKTQKEIETGAASNDPAALRLANEYEAAIKSGDTDRANRIAAFSKIYDKNVMQTPDGQYVPLPGLPQALGNLKYGENLGGETATQQVRSAYEPGRAEDIATRQVGVELGNAASLERQKAAGRASGEQYGANQKKAAQAGNVIDYLDEAATILPKASGSLGGAGLSAIKGLSGYSDETTQANERLRLIAGWMVSNVPRMEGPQSNYDVQNYKQMAADLGNPMKPIGDRLAALNQLRVLQDKYAGTQTMDNSGIPPMEASMLDAQSPALPVPTPPTPNGPQKGDVSDGYMFLGGDPGDQKSWKKVQ